MSKKVIGILRTGYIGGPLGEAHGEFPEMFIEMIGTKDFDYRTYNVIEGEFPAAAEDCDGWIVTGSKHGAYEDHPWIPPLEEFIRKLVASRQPTVGICFGHQIMAQAMGGTVEKFDGGWGIGPQTYTEKDTGKEVTLLAFHQDQVVTPPPGANITHSSDFCAHAGLRYSETCFSLQPHPEHTRSFVKDLIDDRRGSIIPEDVSDRALSLLNDANDQSEYGRRIHDALKG